MSSEEKLNRIRFLPRARKSAKRVHFQRLDELRRVLVQLNEFALLCSEGSLGEFPERWLAKRNIDYVPHDGKDAKQKFGRTAKDDICGRSVDISPHIRIGGSGKQILRIHVAWCEREKKLLIGEVVQHMPYKSA